MLIQRPAGVWFNHDLNLVRRGSLRWPDALSFGPGGYLYVADSAIPDILLRSREHIAEAGPYHIYRFATGATAPAGQ